MRGGGSLLRDASQTLHNEFYQNFFDAIWGEKWSKSWRAICEAELGSLVKMEEAAGKKSAATKKMFSLSSFFHEQEIKITKKTWKNYSAVAAADVSFLFKKEEQKVVVFAKLEIPDS